MDSLFQIAGISLLVKWFSILATPIAIGLALWAMFSIAKSLKEISIKLAKMNAILASKSSGPDDPSDKN